MAISVSSVVNKYLSPVMEKQGYCYTAIPREGIFSFEKSGNKKQIVFVDRSAPNTVRLEFRLTPSYLHKHIAFDNTYWSKIDSAKNKVGPMNGEWVYHNQEEINEIIKLFATAMEDKGFSMIDNAAHDPLDITPTEQMQYDLLRNHQEYANQFKCDCDLGTWDYRAVNDILIRSMIDYQRTFETGKDMEALVHYAAVYGTIFEKMGAEWKMLDNKQCILQMERKDSEIPFKVFPMTTIFHFFHFGNIDNAEILLTNNIQFLARCR